MATRQRTKAPRKTPSNPTSSPAISGEQLSSPSTDRRVKDSQVLRSSFDTTSFDEEASANADGADTSRPGAPNATFTGEQLIYKERYERIAEGAYLRAQQRGFTPGSELDDWLAAEREVDALFSRDDGAVGHPTPRGAK